MQLLQQFFTSQLLAQVRTWALSDNQDGSQNGCHLSVCSCGHSYLVIYHTISFKFHIWTTFIKLLLMSEYGFSPMKDKPDCCQYGYPLFTAGYYALCWSLTVLVKLVAKKDKMLGKLCILSLVLNLFNKLNKT